MKISTVRWLDENGRLVSSGQMGRPSVEEGGTLASEEDIVALGEDFARAVAIKSEKGDVCALLKPDDGVLRDAGFVLIFLARGLQDRFGEAWPDALQRIRFVQIDNYLPVSVERAASILDSEQQGDIVDETLTMLRKYKVISAQFSSDLSVFGQGTGLRLN